MYNLNYLINYNMNNNLLGAGNNCNFATPISNFSNPFQVGNLPVFGGFNFSSVQMPDLSKYTNFNNFFHTAPVFNFMQTSNASLAFPSNTYTFNLENYTLPRIDWSKYQFNIPSLGSLNVGNNQQSLRIGNSTGSAYATLSRSEALTRAQNDSNLERLRGGARWTISNASFKNDIPFAMKGVNNFLDRLTSEIGENLTVTSALGTKNSPHARNAGHYDPINPKLDFGGGLSYSEANRIASKLRNTGYFSNVLVKTHGNTAHIDVKIKESAIRDFNLTA